MHDVGDHFMAVCEVGEHTGPELSCEALTTGYLREQGIL
jgi:hypothetical protein